MNDALSWSLAPGRGTTCKSGRILSGQIRVRVKLSHLLRQYGGLLQEPEVFEVHAPDALECLRVLVDRYPSMRKWVYDKDGKLLGLMQFFVNGEKLLMSEYSKPLQDGDELYIFFATGGG